MSEIKVMERGRELVVNPLVTCQPFGAMFATLGIRRGLPLVHGSQGCSTFVRYGLNRHFREPAEIAVTSLHEDAAVFGGRSNIINGVKNLVKRFRPDLVGIVTTCSSEIIGDDVDGFMRVAETELREELGDRFQTKLVHISTPSFVENHFRGYGNAIKSFIEALAREDGDCNHKLNIIPGIVNPGDIREIGHILELMDITPIILTDTSDPFDSPLRPSKTEQMPFYPPGGTAVSEIEDSSNSMGTLSMTMYGDEALNTLEKRFRVPGEYSMPIGVRNTDDFVRRAARISERDVNDELLDERGILIDSMADLSSRYLFGRTAAVYGDPDMVAGISRFLCELGITPLHTCTGADNELFIDRMKTVAAEADERINVMIKSDLRALEERLSEEPVDLMIGNSDGRLIAQDLGIPLVRVGYPVYDRVGYQRVPITGYRGAVNLLNRITNTVLREYYEPQHWKLQQ
ncbi:nitrogenase component 1 [Methanothermobacter sp. THM-2]|uniref:nitrogenase component 1 n=1 Tax=Methanothermobacter sp. THM-2 TaxID=2606912 RepID=UPI001365BB77|nr:nitrogenase component 1 [Methanothermobacter sp. THM-2]QHN08230.1 nitrogenase molybdenum-iron protein subunit beta [Methanothermobacter sp. THM-2]